MVEMLLQRGARVNATNMGDEIPLHLAAAHGHLDIVLLVSTKLRFTINPKLTLSPSFISHTHTNTHSSFATNRM